MADGDPLPDGPRISEVAETPHEIIHFHCLGCGRLVSKDGAELMKLFPGSVRLWTLARKFRCIECNHVGFTLRMGFKPGAANVPTSVY